MKIAVICLKYDLRIMLLACSGVIVNTSDEEQREF